MPELPEVETTARALRPRLEGRRVLAAHVGWRRTVGGAASFEREVTGTRITTLARRGKFLVAKLLRGGREGGSLLVHLRMSGRLRVLPQEAPRDPHERVALTLDGGERLSFVDPRKFGRFLRVSDPSRALSHLGPEPLDPAFTPDRLQEALAARRRALKPLLLDQRFLAGLGNIYADEALFRAGLHPLRRSDGVRAEEARRLHAAIVRILEQAIRREGSSIDVFYRTPEGRPGGYQTRLRVYGRAGASCRACGHAIRRIVVGQRGTHFCPICQPRRGAVTARGRAGSRRPVRPRA